jgi:hypothetical protein
VQEQAPTSGSMQPMGSPQGQSPAQNNYATGVASTAPQ